MNSDNRDKRQRMRYSNSHSLEEDVLGHGRDASKNFDIWINCGLYSFEDEDGGDKSDRRGRKRSSAQALGHGNRREEEAIPRVIAENYPSFVPSVPSGQVSPEIPMIANPYAVGGIPEHPRIRAQLKAAIEGDEGAYAGMLKFRIREHNTQHSAPSTKGAYLYRQSMSRVSRMNDQQRVPRVPPDLGRNLKLDPIDSKLMKFYLVAFCEGRTLLPLSNVWLHGVATMAESNECVKHALLSMAATYVLDYAPSEKLKAKANVHHKQAVKLLNLELAKMETYKPGGEEVALAALSILNQEDAVNWELHKPRDPQPKWYMGVRTVKYILDRSDPGYRYLKPKNAQCSPFRHHMGNLQAQDDILSAVVAPLDPAEEECPYPWLLEGDATDVTQILGLTGTCPRVLHMFAQITNLSADLQKNPGSTVIPEVASVLLERLQHFHQWSELSLQGYASTEELFQSCVLDETGKIYSAVSSCELTAESYVAAAEIYLHCRLLRKPRKHPDVQKRLQDLIKILEYLPLKGVIYTSQNSLFAVVMAGLVSVTEYDRRVVCEFYGKKPDERSASEPSWRALNDIWHWLDEELEEDSIDDSKPMSDRLAWWELMVDRIMKNEGRISLL